MTKAVGALLGNCLLMFFDVTVPVAMFVCFEGKSLAAGQLYNQRVTLKKHNIYYDVSAARPAFFKLLEA